MNVNMNMKNRLHNNLTNILNYNFSNEYLLDLRLKAAIQRYEGIEKYMEILDINIWNNLKNELLFRINKSLDNDDSLWSNLEYEDEYSYNENYNVN